MKWIKEVDPEKGARSTLTYKLGSTVHVLAVERVEASESEFSMTIDGKWMCDIPDTFGRHSQRRRYATMQLYLLAKKYGALAEELNEAGKDLLQ